jgi:hypothetical protein
VSYQEAVDKLRAIEHGHCALGLMFKLNGTEPGAYDDYDEEEFDGNDDEIQYLKDELEKVKGQRDRLRIEVVEFKNAEHHEYGGVGELTIERVEDSLLAYPHPTLQTGDLTED